MSDYKDIHVYYVTANCLGAGYQIIITLNPIDYEVVNLNTLYDKPEIKKNHITLLYENITK